MDIMTLYEKAKRREVFCKEELVYLLDFKEDSEEATLIKKLGRVLAQEKGKNRAYLWGAVGVDYKKCAMNCDFCSLGEKWNIVKEEYELMDEQIIQYVQEYASQGVRWIVLRTTEFYSIDALCEKVKKIRNVVVGTYELGLNIGEITLQQANQLVEAGVSFMYHSLRMGEGKTTHFKLETRLHTLQVLKDSKLDLVFLIEPVGPEHLNEEIADVFLCAIKYKAKVSGVMARVPVKGTPLGNSGELSASRMAQIAAICRLGSGDVVEDICVHPASHEAMAAGGNVSVIELGSIPRDRCCMPEQKWKDYDVTKAKKWLVEEAYEVYQTCL